MPNRALLLVLLVFPFVGINTVVAVLSVYSSELYPTQVRAKGAGLCAGACKPGGVLIIALVYSGMTPPSMAVVALMGAVPMALAVLVLAWFGVETRRRPVEECHCQTSLTAATLVGNTKLPLRKWFLAIYPVSQAKTGLSALELKRHIAVS